MQLKVLGRRAFKLRNTLQNVCRLSSYANTLATTSR